MHLSKKTNLHILRVSPGKVRPTVLAATNLQSRTTEKDKIRFGDGEVLAMFGVGASRRDKQAVSSTSEFDRLAINGTELTIPSSLA